MYPVASVACLRLVRKKEPAESVRQERQAPQTQPTHTRTAHQASCWCVVGGRSVLVVNVVSVVGLLSCCTHNLG